MAIASRKLDLSLAVGDPRGFDLEQPITSILKVFHEQLIAVHVGGTLSEPDARITTLPTIRHIFDSMNGDEKTAAPGRSN